MNELVVCSLEPWDDVWRRNQFFVSALLAEDAALRVLFVEPPADPLHDLSRRQLPALPRTRRVADRLRAFRPVKPLPRKLGGLADAALLAQVRGAVRLARFARPLLWINDVTYAPLIAATGWPSVYDVTDDWLLAPFAPRELERLGRLDAEALARADEVVVCSPALAESRGRSRPVTLIPNGVDAEHLRRPRPRPSDLPSSPVAVYVGSLHDARLDAELVIRTARALPELSLVFVGPDSLEPETRSRLVAEPNVKLLGPRSYDQVPAYLQHADVLVVPHRVSPFTESLDPIKAYECAVLDRPTVATPVAGFREAADRFAVAEGDAFVEAVRQALEAPRPTGAYEVPSWELRARDFAAVLKSAEAR